RRGPPSVADETARQAQDVAVALVPEPAMADQHEWARPTRLRWRPDESGHSLPLSAQLETTLEDAMLIEGGVKGGGHRGRTLPRASSVIAAASATLVSPAMT